MKNLRLSIISLFLIGWLSASACMAPEVSRWYMFCFCNQGDFRERYDKETEQFWTDYVPGYKEWISWEDRFEAAKSLGDKEMLEYLDALEAYENVVSMSYRDSWDYPTAEELATRRGKFQQLLSVAKSHRNGEYAERWMLLTMRANMMVGNYEDNLKAWEEADATFRDGSIYKEMMRNIYANALLHTGNHIEAWNIYALQNDENSLLWSVRKYTNLAGIKEMQGKYPNAPILSYLLQYYVNCIQDAIDCYEDSKSNGITFEINDLEPSHEAFASIDKDYLNEIREFAQYANEVAHHNGTTDPSMWMSASALTCYFLHDYETANARIAEAMEMDGSQEVKDMTRRIRMLLSTANGNLQSPEFKKWMVGELQWLDKEIASGGEQSFRALRARDRILNLGLSKAYRNNDPYLSAAIQLTRVDEYYIRSAGEYNETLDLNQDHSSNTFNIIWSFTPEMLIGYFQYFKQHADDPLAVYAFSKVSYSDNYINDIIGTKYLACGEFEKALPYLEKVSLNYLQKQKIARYAYTRDFNFPAWGGYQDSADMENPPLRRNIKADYCKRMMSLEGQYAKASGAHKKELALALATCYYQGSNEGLCWFLGSYRQGYPYGYNIDFTEEADGELEQDEFCAKAIALLEEAAESTDSRVRAEAYAGLAYTSDDYWCDYDYDYLLGTWKHKINRNSKQYSYLNMLDIAVRGMGTTEVPEYISHCDVLKQFRKS